MSSLVNVRCKLVTFLFKMPKEFADPLYILIRDGSLCVKGIIEWFVAAGAMWGHRQGEVESEGEGQRGHGLYCFLMGRVVVRSFHYNLESYLKVYSNF